jgi:hypothetical protein
MTILDAIRDTRLLGGLAALRDHSTWQAWLTFLGAVYGLPLTSDEIARFCHHTGRTRYDPPQGGWKEVVCITGRQSGKSQIAALLAAYEAMVSAGSRKRAALYALMVAQDQRGAMRTLLSYAAQPFEEIDLLRSLVERRTTDSLRLHSGVTLAAYPCRPAAVRGLRACVVIADELGFFRSTHGNPIDTEMLRALRPTLATTGGRLVILSSPYGPSGALWDLHRQHFRCDAAPILVWQASAPDMNPTLPSDYLHRMEQDDLEAYRSEVLGEFRPGVATFFDAKALQACVEANVRERPYNPRHRYTAFCDPSGGRQDFFAVAVAHTEKGIAILDAVRSWAPPFNPLSVVAEAAGLLTSYRVSDVHGDQYAAEFVAEAFRTHRINYVAAAQDRSGIYLSLLPRVNAGCIVLLDAPDLLRELRGLERRRGLAGRDRIDHRPGSHDDLANAAAGVLLLAAEDGTRAPLIFGELGNLKILDVDGRVRPLEELRQVAGGVTEGG